MVGKTQLDVKELKNELKAVLTDPDKQEQSLDLLFQLLERVKNSNIAEAWSLAREALHMAEKLNSEQRKAKAHLAIADCSWKMAQVSLALDHYRSALNMFLHLQDHEGAARSYNGMGIVCAETDELEQALEYFENAMHYIKYLPTSKLAALITSNIGHLYFKSQRITEAMQCFEHALEKYTVLQDLKGQADVLNGIAGIHVQTGDYEKGLHTMQRAQELRRREKSEPSERVMAIDKMNMGITLLRMGKYDKAKQELQEAYELMLAVRFALYQPEVLKHLMHVSIELGDTAAFDEYLDVYEECCYEDIIHQAHQRQKQFREFQNIETYGLQQLLN